MNARFRFDGMIFVPDGTRDQLQLRELALPKDSARTLFKSFAGALRDGAGFEVNLNSGGSGYPIAISFRHFGTTAALFALSHDNGDKPKSVHGVTALLSKLDPEEDRAAIAGVRKFPCVRRLSETVFEEPLNAPHPLAASFFADISSANYPPLHSIIRVLAAAFFTQFGIVNEDESDDSTPNDQQLEN